MIDGINIPIFIFDDFTPENTQCPIKSYKIMCDTENTLDNDLIMVLGKPNKI